MMVLFCISDLRKGGAEKVLTALCTHAGGVYTPRVVALTGGWYERVLADAGIRVDVLRPAGASWFSAVRRLRALAANTGDIDCIYGFLPLGGCIGAAIKWRTGKPLLYAIRSSLRYFGLMKQPVRWLLHLISLQSADASTVNSPAVKQHLRTRKPVHIILNGVEAPPPDRCEDDSVRREFFPDDKRAYVVSVCSLRPPRKPSTLLDVAATMREVGFVLVGDGVYLPRLKRRVESEGLSNVALAGFRENVWPFLRYAQAFVLLTDHEGFPNSVLEAMVMGLPVVISDIPEVRGVLTPGNRCALVKNRDIAGIAAAIMRTREAGPHADARKAPAADAFSMAAMVRETASILGRVADGG